MRSAVPSERTTECATMIFAEPRSANCRAALGVASVAPAGAARIWLDRDYEPFVSLNLANVALNGAPAALTSTPASGSADRGQPRHASPRVSRSGYEEV